MRGRNTIRTIPALTCTIVISIQVSRTFKACKSERVCGFSSKERLEGQKKWKSLLTIPRRSIILGQLIFTTSHVVFNCFTVLGEYTKQPEWFLKVFGNFTTKTTTNIQQKLGRIFFRRSWADQRKWMTESGLLWLTASVFSGKRVYIFLIKLTVSNSCLVCAVVVYLKTNII